MTDGAPQHSIERCGLCTQFSNHPGPLAKYGFNRCARQAVWESMSQEAVCAFRPTRWTQGAPDESIPPNQKSPPVAPLLAHE